MNIGMTKNQKVYIKENGVRFRRSPDSSDERNIIKEFSKDEEVVFLDGPWVKVVVGDQEGWVHEDYVNETPSAPPQSDPAFIVGRANRADDATTKTVRAAINDEFHLGASGENLNCTEYVQYRVKTKLGITIRWPVKSGRNGGAWWKIFQDAGLYKILAEPQANCAMCFTAGIRTHLKNGIMA